GQRRRSGVLRERSRLGVRDRRPAPRSRPPRVRAPGCELSGRLLRARGAEGRAARRDPRVGAARVRLGQSMRRVVAVALALVAATAVSHILRARLVAMSPQPTGLPPFVWLAVTSPSWMTGLTGGMCLRSWRQIALAALLAAVALQSYETWAINAPLLFWMVSILVTAGGGLQRPGRWPSEPARHSTPEGSVAKE